MKCWAGFVSTVPTTFEVGPEPEEILDNIEERRAA